jgi:hypothetical protein
MLLRTGAGMRPRPAMGGGPVHVQEGDLLVTALPAVMVPLPVDIGGALRNNESTVQSQDESVSIRMRLTALLIVVCLPCNRSIPGYCWSKWNRPLRTDIVSHSRFFSLAEEHSPTVPNRENMHQRMGSINFMGFTSNACASATMLSKLMLRSPRSTPPM